MVSENPRNAVGPARQILAEAPWIRTGSANHWEVRVVDNDNEAAPGVPVRFVMRARGGDEIGMSEVLSDAGGAATFTIATESLPADSSLTVEAGIVDNGGYVVDIENFDVVLDGLYPCQADDYIPELPSSSGSAIPSTGMGDPPPPVCGTSDVPVRIPIPPTGTPPVVTPWLLRKRRSSMDHRIV